MECNLCYDNMIEVSKNHLYKCYKCNYEIEVLE